MPSFTHPKHKGRTNNNYYPILQTQTANIKKLLKAWYLYHCYLSNHNDSHNGKQSFTTFEMQCTTPSLKSTCVEKIEEVSHHKNCEEQCQFVSSYVSFFAQLKCQQICELMNVCVLEDIKQPEQHHKEETSHTYNVCNHLFVKNECVTVARFILHHAL